MESVSIGWLCDFTLAVIPLQSELPKKPRSCLIVVTIKWRSGLESTMKSCLLELKSCVEIVAVNPR